MPAPEKYLGPAMRTASWRCILVVSGAAQPPGPERNTKGPGAADRSSCSNRAKETDPMTIPLDPPTAAPSGVFPAVLAERLPGWLEDGADGDELLATCRALPPGQTPGTVGWVRNFVATGDAHATRARALTAAGTMVPAGREELAAAFCYFLARFPHVFGPEAADAYAQHRAAYLRAARFFDPPLQVVHVPSEGEEPIVGYLRVPTRADGAPPPVVLLSGGIDVWKSDAELHLIGETLLRQGLATFALDAPGTGENPVLAAPGAERVFLAALAHLRRRDDVAGDRIGFYGLSFGGHWAVRTACADRALSAVVNVGGPIHRSFAPEWCARLNSGLLATLARVTGGSLAELGPAGVCARLQALSLLEGGLLTPDSVGAALLSINGAQDEAVTIADLDLITECGVAQDALVFAGDRHTASRHRTLYLPFAARWLARHLEG
jgi:esterase FrsA